MGFILTKLKLKLSFKSVMSKLYMFLLFTFIIFQSLFLQAKENATFCNPLNIDYQPFGKNACSAADPVIVPFNGKYYLFCSLYKGATQGYRVSENLLDWKLIPFPSEILKEILNEKAEAYAPAVIAMDGYLYSARLDENLVIRSNNPENPNSWQVYSKKAFTGFDPAYFLDDDGKLYDYFGALESNVALLNKDDFAVVSSLRKQITPKTKTPEVLANSNYGLYRGKNEYESGRSDWNKVETLDTARLIPTNPPKVPQFETLSKDSMQEAAWLTKYNGKYYLQNSNPGTACPWYSDSVWVSDSPEGPFEMPDYATASMKVGGFINSTGHSCVFQDFYGNYWRVTTMWVGVHAGFERRIGLFPVFFNKVGQMATHTEFGDYPMYMPNEKLKNPEKNLLTAWNLLTKNAKVESSSTHSKFIPQNASDENVRTFWSAKSGDAGEWISLDMEKVCDVYAVQINFAELDIDQNANSEDYNSYKLYASLNGKDWTLLADKSQNKKRIVHEYIELEKPTKARFLKLENFHSAKKGKFAISDIRAFGFTNVAEPEAVVDAHALRDSSDTRNITLFWTPSKSAQGYVIYYGVSPDALLLNVQYQKPDAEKLTLSCFNKDAKDYYFRIDSYNEGGVTKGKVFKAKTSR